MRRVHAVSAIVFVVAVAVGSFLFLRPDSCDGIPREMGGCDSELASYTADTCLGIAAEWGRLIDSKLLEVIRSDEPRRGKGAITTTRVCVITTRANQRLRELGLISECDADEFFARGSKEFSTELTQRAPEFMYDAGDAADYEEWEAMVRRSVGSIDVDEATNT